MKKEAKNGRTAPTSTLRGTLQRRVDVIPRGAPISSQPLTGGGASRKDDAHVSQVRQVDQCPAILEAPEKVRDEPQEEGQDARPA